MCSSPPPGLRLDSPRRTAGSLLLDSGHGSGTASRVASKAAGEFENSADDRILTWGGMHHLHAALTAAALGRTDDAAPHLAEAERAAARVVTDLWLQELTPTNVDLWHVGIALENGEPEKAPALARRVDRSKIRGVRRRASLHIDTGLGRSPRRCLSSRSSARRCCRPLCVRWRGDGVGVRRPAFDSRYRRSVSAPWHGAR